MKILLTKTLPTEDGLYYWAYRSGESPVIVDVFIVNGGAYCNIVGRSWSDIARGYWAKVDQSIFQLCESEQERREIIQKQHSNDTHRAVDIDRPEPECKCKDCNLIKMDSDKNKNKSMCLNCFKWSKRDA